MCGCCKTYVLRVILDNYKNRVAASRNMEIKKLAKELKLTKKELNNYGVEEECTINATANTIKEFYYKIAVDFETLLHPESGLSTMLEHSFLTEKDLSNSLNCFIVLAKIIRNYDLKKIEGELTNWIKQSHKEYSKIKNSVIEINQKLLKGWEKDLTKKNLEEYFG